MRTAILLAIAALLAGCVTATVEGKPEYVTSLSRSGLEQVRAACRMRLRDKKALMIATGNIDPWDAYDDAYDCFAAQGVTLKGFRQPDGTLTRYPFIIH